MGRRNATTQLETATVDQCGNPQHHHACVHNPCGLLVTKEQWCRKKYVRILVIHQLPCQPTPCLTHRHCCSCICNCSNCTVLACEHSLLYLQAVRLHDHTQSILYETMRNPPPKIHTCPDSVANQPKTASHPWNPTHPTSHGPCVTHDVAPINHDYPLLSAISINHYPS